MITAISTLDHLPLGSTSFFAALGSVTDAHGWQSRNLANNQTWFFAQSLPFVVIMIRLRDRFLSREAFVGGLSVGIPATEVTIKTLE